MLLYCKFICSLWVERQIKALHQNQSQKPRKAHRRPLNSKYQSISPTFFFFLSNLQVLLSTVFLNCQAAAGCCGERSEGIQCGAPLWHSGLSSWGALMLKGFLALEHQLRLKLKACFYFCLFALSPLKVVFLYIVANYINRIVIGSWPLSLQV